MQKGGVVEAGEQSGREVAAMSVVRMIGTFLRDGGEIPEDLALSIGGCLEDYVDIHGKIPDPDLQVLFDGVVKICS